MSDSPRPTFSFRDVLARLRRVFPWPVRPPFDPPGERDVAAERLRVQVGVVRRAFEKKGGVSVAGREGPRRPADDADASYLYRPGHLLVRDDDFGLLDEFFRDPARENDFRGELERVDEPSPGLLVVRVPSRTDEGDDVLTTLDEVDRAHPDRAERRDPVATPDHVLYVTVRGYLCPATEPAEPCESAPWPPQNPDRAAGGNVQVSVVDTGLWTDAIKSAVTKDWMDDVSPASNDDIEHINPAAIHPYGGHGTFVAGVVGCLAPAATIEVEGVLVNGGAVYESEICKQLDQAINDDDHPQLISISAGTHTRSDFTLLTFEMLAATYGLGLGAREGKKLLIVAAAGNDSSDQPFYPAAFDWVVGVGSVDPDGKKSDFSNFNSHDPSIPPSVKVWARGRDLVNAFPDGTYTCHEPPNVGDVRNFKGLAQWSGTSFSTPVVTGLIAAHMSATGNTDDPRKAYDDLIGGASKGPDGLPLIGPL
jgi:hypothetical protein